MNRMRFFFASLVILATVSFAADEITQTVYLKATKTPGSTLIRSPGTIQIDWNGTRYFSTILKLSTNWLPVSKGAVDTNGIIYVANLSTNINTYFSFDCGTTTNLMLRAEEYFVMRLDKAFSVTNISVKAASGTPDFEFTILED